MNQITTAGARLETADGLAATLDAAYIAFESILAVLRQHQERSGPGFPAFVLAAAAAGNGRDWIAEAATSPASISPPASGGLSSDDDWVQAAAEITVLGSALADHLEAAAANAVDPRDQAACQRSMFYAQRISSLLAGAQQT